MSASPIFKDSSVFTETGRSRAIKMGDLKLDHGNVMTYPNTLNKSVIVFGMLLVGIMAGWMWSNNLLALAALLVSFVLSIIIVASKTVRVPLIVIASVIYGYAIGTVSLILEARMPGIVLQAILGTMSVVAVVYVLFRFAGFRTTPKLTRMFYVLLAGAVLYSIVNIVLVATGLVTTPWGMDGIKLFGFLPLGVVMAVLCICLGAYSLVIDFEYVTNGVNGGLPERYGWVVGYGIVMTIAWIYIEMLRLFGNIRVGN